MRDRLRMPTREELLANRWLRPFAAYLSSPLIWRFNRRGVSRGAALGLFSGFAVPIAQTPFAALCAVGARANLPVAALSTFVTNPLTVPFIYYLAYLVGSGLLRIKAETIFAQSANAGFVERSLIWMVTLAGPTYLGLLLFAAIGGLVGYFGVQLGWRIWVGQRWERRRRQRSQKLKATGAPQTIG